MAKRSRQIFGLESQSLSGLQYPGIDLELACSGKQGAGLGGWHGGRSTTAPPAGRKTASKGPQRIFIAVQPGEILHQVDDDAVIPSADFKPA